MTSLKKLKLSLVLFISIFLLGTIGFKLVGGRQYSLLDCVYMTVITISTIGYGEIVDLSHKPAGRLFATVFIILSLGTIAFAVSSITAFVVEGELKNILGRKKMAKEIQKLSDHYIVCGSDETALTAIQELRLTKRPFVVIEPSAERIEKIKALGSILFIQGDPTDESVLKEAGLDQAKGIFLSLPTDEANLFATFTVRGLNPNIRIVVKVIDIRSQAKMIKAGANSAISPAFIGGMRMVSEMIRPAATTFLDMMLRDKEKVLRVEEVTIKPGSSLCGQTLAEAGIEEKTGALLVAIKKAGSSDYEFNPPKSHRLEPEETLILIATPQMVQNLNSLASL
ncbi:MAG: potassium channel protein [Candidatus Aminicenantes bacterium]|nr:potassium channel protein [Candidatus Aminicenantes bacterium]